MLSLTLCGHDYALEDNSGSTNDSLLLSSIKICLVLVTRRRAIAS